MLTGAIAPGLCTAFRHVEITHLTVKKIPIQVLFVVNGAMTIIPEVKTCPRRRQSPDN
jgi:hypothetical protein